VNNTDNKTVKVLCESWGLCSNNSCTHGKIHDHNASCENDCGHDIPHTCKESKKKKF
jgi:hypothetical protein